MVTYLKDPSNLLLLELGGNEEARVEVVLHL
jgi:hypothetical protein